MALRTVELSLSQRQPFFGWNFFSFKWTINAVSGTTTSFIFLPTGSMMQRPTRFAPHDLASHA
jgi:hypothetical protein